MTSSISFGAPVPKSIQAQALEQIDYRNQPFANKDFVRNMQWLNESVTSLSQYTQLLQKGVDSANNNILEQIQSFAADLFLIFAGLEPTGIDLGDLTYVLQGIGSLLGINPDTPFPLNLFEAAWHLFSNFIVPLPQFTDLIFDAIIAWAMSLGFSDEAVDAIQGFSDAVVDLYNDIEDIFGILGDAFKYLLKGLGLGSGSINLGPITDFWNNVTSWINDILEGPRDLLLNILNNIVIALFKSMTWFVNTVNPKHILEATGIRFIGPELAPDISDLTTVWSVGSNPNSQWVFDSTLSSGGSSGCFKTNGTGSTKRVLTQGVIPVTAGSSYHLSGQTKWTNIPSNFNSFGPCVVWLSGLNEVSQTNVNTPSGHGEDGGWTQAAQEVVAPANVDGCMIGCRVSSTLTRGTVYVDQISFTGEANLGMGLAQGILDFPKNLFNAVKASLTALYEFFFGQDSLLGKVLADVIPALDASIIATGKFAQELVDGLGDALSNLGTAVNTALDGVGDLLYDLWNNPAEVLGNIAQSMVDGLETAFTNVGNWVTDVSNWVQDVIDAVIGALTGIPIIGGVIQNIIDGFENLFDWLFGQTTPKATLAGAAIPALDASKIDRGVFAEEIIPDLDGAKIAKGTVVAQRIGELDASKIKTGILGEAIVPDLPASKITSGTLEATVVPDLPASKITSGTLATTLVPDLPASKITSGTLGTDQIPTLNADKIGAGTLNTSRIPDLAADKITSGTLNTSRIPSLAADKITSGTLGTDRIPSLAADKIDGLGDALSNLGTAVNTALDGVGDLLYDLWNNPAEVLGNIAQSMVDGLETAFTNVGNWVTDVSNWVQDVIDAVIGALTGIPIIGGVIQNIIDGFENLFDWLFGQTTPKATLAGAAIPALDASKIDRGVFAEEIIPDLDGAKIAKGTVVAQRIGELDASKIKTGILGEAIVPDLPASKITSGTLEATVVPDLPASKITSGTLATTLVPDLPASKITSGTLGTDQIPTLNADKIGAGTLNTSRIPDLAADKITSGTLNTSRIPSLAADKITSGTLGTDRIPSLAADKITSGTLNTGRIPNITRSMSTDLQATITNVYQGWYGTAGSGDASTVSTTIAAIKTSIGGGWTVEVLPFPSGTWTRPYATNQFLDFWAICIASGGGGGSGSANTSTPVSGGAGGLGGKYLAQQINPSSIPATVNYVIGAGGAGSPGRLNGGANIPAGGSNNTNFGTLANTANATTSAIGSLVGFYDGTSSQAGDGGNGGSNSTAATAGNATPLASGGAAGNPGGGGGTVNLSTSQSRCGGGGGGGGSYGSGSGGNGGAGGYPGGGGGGGGGRTGIGVTSGSGGAGADGAIVLLYKVAT